MIPHILMARVYLLLLRSDLVENFISVFVPILNVRRATNARVRIALIRHG